MYSPDPILILQLSDLHFGPFSRFADVPPETLGDRFSLSIGSEIRRRGLNQKVSVVVVSGDVAEAARPAEYANAEVFFATLAVKLELDRRRFVFIPGNHDVSWPACKRAEADQEEFGFNDEKLRNLIDQNKFSNFERFLDSFYEMPRAAATAAVALPDRAFVYDFNELELSVAGLNSCETESHRRQDHKGLISEPQAQALMTRWSSDEYSKWIKVIAVHHNPVVTVKENLDEIILQLKNIKDLQEAAVECYASDMLGFDGTEFLKRIVEDCEVQLLLHGHHHAADVQLWPWRRDGRGGHTHILSAGSGLLDQKKLPKDHPNTLRLIALDPAREKIRSWVLEYRPRALARGVVARGQFVALDEAYEQGLSLPQKFPQALLLKEQAARSMSEVLEHLRQDQFDQARKKLRDLEKLLADLPEQFLSRTLYNRACVESAYAEGLSKKDANRAVALEEASRDLGEWLKIGLGGAWAREGKTERNEIHRMGSDSDLGCLLAERRSVILSKIPEEFRTALPQKLPKRRSGGGGGGGGGGCIPGHALIQTPLGLTPAACLREGDQITSLALGSRPLPVTTRVAQVHASRAPECILLNDTLMFTSSQPLYLYVGGLILAGDVEVGMDLLGSTALPISVKEKRTVPGYYEVYNLSTDHQTHNYVAYDSILCHNDKS